MLVDWGVSKLKAGAASCVKEGASIEGMDGFGTVVAAGGSNRGNVGALVVVSVVDCVCCVNKFSLGAFTTNEKVEFGFSASGTTGEGTELTFKSFFASAASGLSEFTAGGKVLFSLFVAREFKSTDGTSCAFSPK